MSPVYIACYWLMHQITGRPVVLLRDRWNREVLRLVRLRLALGARRPVVTDSYGLDPIVLLIDGKTTDDLDSHWEPLFGAFKPSVIGHKEALS